MTHAAEADTCIHGCGSVHPILLRHRGCPFLACCGGAAPAKRPLLRLLRRSLQAVPADEALCALLDSKATDREIIIWAFCLNGLCWIGLLYSFGAF